MKLKLEVLITVAAVCSMSLVAEPAAKEEKPAPAPVAVEASETDEIDLDKLGDSADAARKAPTVKITPKVFDQIANYNFVLNVDVLIVSNGLEHYCCRMDGATKKYVFLRDIPEYQSLNW